MCPVCLTTAALIAGSVTSTGGLAAIVIKKFSAKNTGAQNVEGKSTVDKKHAPIRSKEDDHV